MNKPVVLLAATTVMFGATSAYLAQALIAERALRAAGVSERSDSQVPRQEAAPVVAGTTNEPADSLNASKEAGLNPAAKLPERVVNRTYSSARLAELKLQLQDEYPDLATALGLQPDEAAGFFELLAQQKAREQQDSLNSSEQSGKVDWQKQRELNREADRAEQAAYLGAARASEWTRYLDTMASRDEVRDLRMRLADSDYPMRRDQYEALIAVLGDEQIRHKHDREQLRGQERYAANPRPAVAIEYFGKRLTLIEESLTRRGRAAASLLDSEQLRRYQAMLEHDRLRAQAEYESFVTLNAEAARNSK